MHVHITAYLPYELHMSCFQQQPSVSRHAHQNQSSTLREYALCKVMYGVLVMMTSFLILCTELYL